MPRIDASRFAGSKKKVKSFAYTCSRNMLAAINSIFIFIGLILIGITAAAKKEAVIVSIPALGGLIACGVFLLLIAILGLIGAIRHNQIILFFYMIIMSILFILLLAFSVAALAITKDQQQDLIRKGWLALKQSDPVQLKQLEKKLHCCGLDNEIRNTTCEADNKYAKVRCYDQIGGPLDKGLSIAGGVGLFFSFALLLAVYLTVRYRNQKDPRMNADAFL
ncbi:tetraspanin-31-like [Hydractinia symbiolongicarpus]|uniref:tetraspanin-31-like n=1 Tax=Hydractinia symbiolongicarpus TaxID=13093 RepID=UPI00254B393A|nr:tetraspanin-31-like [Hydractinia symbiolongicarpus]